MIMLQLQDLARDEEFSGYATFPGVLEKTISEQKIASLYWHWFDPVGLDEPVVTEIFNSDFN